MTVSELIAVLSTVDPTLPVNFSYDSRCGYGVINVVDIENEEEIQYTELYLRSETKQQREVYDEIGLEYGIKTKRLFAKDLPL